jgi:UDP-2,3-diacylglucosamine pyrophosphatase LpxH
VKKYILSDLHIGLKYAQYDVMDQAIGYIRKNAKPGDEIWGLGDWFHIYENGFDHCISHPMTQKFRDLAREIPIKLIPGNHDRELGKYRNNPGLSNPIGPINIIKPFIYSGLWYCHGHVYDPSVTNLPRSFMWIWNQLWGRTTPGNLKTNIITQRYLMLVYLVHSRALLSIKEKTKKEYPECKGIVLGHTHMPLHQDSPGLPFLLNVGDMRHSSTFSKEDDVNFYHLTWNSGQKQWEEMAVPRP